MIASNRWNEFSTYSHYLTRLMWPVIYVVDLPDHVVEKSQLFLQDRTELLSEKNNLAQQQIYLQAQVQKLQALEAENLELRELLRSMGPKAESFSEARLMQVDLDPFSQQILLNKGKRNGVEGGQPVIDAHGLVGIVLAADEHTSRVLLLSDPSFAVPVQSVRSGERAIATGSGTGGELRLNYVPRTADFMEGDQLVTSGLGGKFPAGYPVGMITSIQDDPTTRFTLIGVSPAAKLGQMRHVLLLKHHPAAIQEELQPVEQAQNDIPTEQVKEAPVKTPPPIVKKAQSNVIKPVTVSESETVTKIAEPVAPKVLVLEQSATPQIIPSTQMVVENSKISEPNETADESSWFSED